MTKKKSDIHTEGEWCPINYGGFWNIQNTSDYTGMDLLDEEKCNQAEANAKLMAQSKNNFKLLQEIESIYLNKKQVNGLNGFEPGILLSIQEAIKKSI